MFDMSCVEESLNWKYQYAIREFGSGLHRSVRSSIILELNYLSCKAGKGDEKIHTLTQFFHNQLEYVSIRSSGLLFLSELTNSMQPNQATSLEPCNISGILNEAISRSIYPTISGEVLDFRKFQRG